MMGGGIGAPEFGLFGAAGPAELLLQPDSSSVCVGEASCLLPPEEEEGQQTGMWAEVSGGESRLHSGLVLVLRKSQ